MAKDKSTFDKEGRPAEKWVRPKPSELFTAIPVPKPLKDSKDAAEALEKQVRQERKAIRVHIREKDARLLYRYVRREDERRMGPTLEGPLLDISTTGLKLEGPLAEGVSRDALIEGDVLVGVNVFFLTVDEPFRALGRVAWVKPGRRSNVLQIGVSFLHKADDADSILQAYLIHTGTRTRFK